VVPTGGGVTQQGSGTIVAVQGGKALIVTAKHVTSGHTEGITVTLRGKSYPAQLLEESQSSDLAALAIDAPPGIDGMLIAEEQPQEGVMLGYGSSGQLHEHRGPYIGGSGVDSTYQFVTGHGDSGGGVFDRNGRFAGVLWGSDFSRTAAAVSTQEVRRFLRVSSGKRIVTISPFFIKFRREWAEDPTPAPSPQPVPAPSPAPIVTNPPVDLGPLEARVGKLEGQVGTLTTNLQGLTDSIATVVAATRQLQATVAKPITFQTPGPSGPISAPARLGDTVTLNPFAVPAQPTR
jgi:hypothetical protein